MKIISGGQTGVDRAALDVAIKLKIPHGGFCPKNRKSEDGKIPKKYNLKELDSAKYKDRTLKNILYSDATLIFYEDILEGGTEKTLAYAIKYKKKYFLVNFSIISRKKAIANLTSFIKENNIKSLNIAGSRHSKNPKIYKKTVSFLKKLFSDLELNANS